jgi:hypothetical protein
LFFCWQGSCGCFPGAWRPTKKQLSAALAAVEANLKTDAGKQYDAQMGRDFHDHPVNLKPCKQPGTALPGSFDLLLRLKSDGKVDQALVYPESQFANCARDAFSAAKFSPPPHGDYWVNIHMQFNK